MLLRRVAFPDFCEPCLPCPATQQIQVPVAKWAASFGALLTSMVILAGCVGRLPFESPKVVEYLDGNYRTLASCTHRQLSRQHGQLTMTDLHERRTVTISTPEAQWELSFIDEDGGRQTRLEVRAHGALPGEHALALARACAA
jgi:hypothetical protein